jgi:hypothetical protein
MSSAGNNNLFRIGIGGVKKGKPYMARKNSRITSSAGHIEDATESSYTFSVLHCICNEKTKTIADI